MGEDDPEQEDFFGFEDQITSSPLTQLEATQNNSLIEPSELFQDSGYSTQLSFNDSDLNLSESLQTTINSVDETLIREAELEEAEDNSRIQNVENWSDYVTPLLQQSKCRSSFNIQKYGQEILKEFTEINEEVTFKSIMERKRPDFTARNFLSVLMLANTGNVKIKNCNTDINRPSRSDEIKLQLLTREMFYETNYDMEDMPKRVKKNFTHAPSLNILPLGDNFLESKKKRSIEFIDSRLDDSQKRFRAT